MIDETGCSIVPFMQQHLSSTPLLLTHVVLISMARLWKDSIIVIRCVAKLVALQVASTIGV